MLEKFVKRENLILDVLQEFAYLGLPFIIVGGYGVSAYKHRFSVDADVVIEKNVKEKFEGVLIKRNFAKTVMKELAHLYAPEFIRYETKGELPVSIDLLIGGVASRTTNALFGFKEIKEFSAKRKIIGIEREITALVPDREMLIVLKLHAGRLTDFRDVVALSKKLDFKVIKKLVWRGKKSIVESNIKKLLSLIERKEFIDSFKGVFIEKRYDVDIAEVKKFRGLLNKD